MNIGFGDEHELNTLGDFYQKFRNKSNHVGMWAAAEWIQASTDSIVNRYKQDGLEMMRVDSMSTIVTEAIRQMNMYRDWKESNEDAGT